MKFILTVGGVLVHALIFFIFKEISTKVIFSRKLRDIEKITLLCLLGFVSTFISWYITALVARAF